MKDYDYYLDQRIGAQPPEYTEDAAPIRGEHRD